MRIIKWFVVLLLLSCTLLRYIIAPLGVLGMVNVAKNKKARMAPKVFAGLQKRKIKFNT